MERYQDKKMLFYDKEGKILGCGILRKSGEDKWYIEEMPRTCGCNGIDIMDVGMSELLEDRSTEFINNMMRKDV